MEVTQNAQLIFDGLCENDDNCGPPRPPQGGAPFKKLIILSHPTTEI